MSTSPYITYDIGLGGYGVDSWKQPDFTGHKDVTIPEWCDRVGVWPAIVPFKYRVYDPVTIIDEFRDGFDAAPPTKSSLRVSDWRKDTKSLGDCTLSVEPSTAGHIAQDVFPFLGGWEVTGSSTVSRSAAYVNPQYVHRHTEGGYADEDDRDETIKRWASLGVHDHSDIADRLGMDEDDVAPHCDRLDWDDRCRDGQARLARTICLIDVWGDRSLDEIITALGLEHDRVYEWVNEHVVSTYWSPPDDPTRKPWFGQWDKDYRARVE